MKRVKRPIFSYILRLNRGSGKLGSSPSGALNYYCQAIENTRPVFYLKIKSSLSENRLGLSLTNCLPFLSFLFISNYLFQLKFKKKSAASYPDKNKIILIIIIILIKSKKQRTYIYKKKMVQLILSSRFSRREKKERGETIVKSRLSVLSSPSLTSMQENRQIETLSLSLSIPSPYTR